MTAPLYRLSAPAFWFLKRLIGIIPIRLIRSLVANSAGVLPQTRAYIETCLVRFEKAALLELAREIDGALVPGPYPAPKSPILIIYGEKDLIALGLNRYLARRWASFLGIDAHRISGASHNANMDRPDAVNALILELLRSGC